MNDVSFLSSDDCSGCCVAVVEKPLYPVPIIAVRQHWIEEWPWV